MAIKKKTNKSSLARAPIHDLKNETDQTTDNSEKYSGSDSKYEVDDMDVDQDVSTAQTSENFGAAENMNANVPDLTDEPTSLENTIQSLHAAVAHTRFDNLVIILVLSVVAFILAYTCQTMDSVFEHIPFVQKEEFNMTHVHDSFVKEFRKFKTEFPSQTKDFGILFSAIKDTMLLSEPKEPACILLIGEDKFKQNTNCFAHRLSKVVQNAFKILPNVEEDTIVIEIEENKTHVDKMKEQVQPVLNHAVPTVLVKDMEKLSSKSADFFHWMCDNEGAMVKRMVMFITVNLPSEKMGKNNDIFYMWRGKIPEENIKALDSRIGNNMVVLDSKSIQNCDPDFE